MDIKKPIMAVAMLVVGFLIFYAIGGFRFSLIYLMLWIDKVIFGELKTPLHFGVELYSIPAILVGIIYGPFTGFLFGFLAMPIIWGIFDILYPLLTGASLLDTGWEPFFPSPESFISGAIGLLAGVFAPHISFFAIVAVCMGARFGLSILKDALASMPPNIIAYSLNVTMGLSVGFVLREFLIPVFIA